MNRHFDNQLDEIRNLILSMGGHVEKALDEAIQALLHRSSERFNNVHELEKLINANHIKVDEACLNFLAKQGPVAKDLRLVMSVIKINTDLERMGDQAVNIAHTGKDFLQRNSIDGMDDIVKMSEIARRMVRRSLDAFVQDDEVVAREILLMDDEVDDLKSKVFRELQAYMKIHPESVEAALDLILVARNLERLGDHATNIAEDVIFVSTGEDVRHGGKQSQ